MPDGSKMYGSVEAESEGLLGYQVYESQPQTPPKRYGAAKVAVAVLGVCGLAAAAVYNGSSTTASAGTALDARNPPRAVKEEPHHSEATSSAGALKTSMLGGTDGYTDPNRNGQAEVFTASNSDYGSEQTYAMYPWIKDRLLVEPYRYTTLTVEDGRSNVSFHDWQIESPSGYHHNISTNSSIYIVHQFTEVGTYKVTLTAGGNKTGHLIWYYTHFEEILCRYVKRELRTLTHNDRDEFLQAMVTMWKTSAGDGRELYGDMFTSIDEFVLHHAYQSSGDVYCDHFHEGAGFMTHHFAMTMAFESTLRAVNPKVTMPYWDFTIEGEEILDASGDPSMLFDVSPFFNATWFGSTNDEHHIADGLWAHTKSPVAQADDISGLGPNVANSYGIIRAPWNNSPEPEMARATSNICGLVPTNKAIPTCWDHWMVLTQLDLGQYLVMLPGAGHGPMHVQTGGIFGDCEDNFASFYEKHAEELSGNLTEGHGSNIKSYNMKSIFEEKMQLELFHQYRTLWRSQTCAHDGLPYNLECPESCDSSDAQADCTCKCKDVDSDDWDWKNIEPCLYANNGTKSLIHEWYSEEIRYDYTKMICTTGIREGDNLESASPVDPIFWMIHPVLERLTTAKRLSTNSSIMYGDYGTIPPFTNDTWVRMSIYDPYGPNGDDDYECYGHAANDSVIGQPGVGLNFLPWTDAYADFDGDGDISNWEFYKATDPTVFEALDYVYDNFEWSHCIPHDDDDASTTATVTSTATDNSTVDGVDGWSEDDRTPGGTDHQHEHTESCGKGCTETVYDDDTTYGGPATSNSGGSTTTTSAGGSTSGTNSGPASTTTTGGATTSSSSSSSAASSSSSTTTTISGPVGPIGSGHGVSSTQNSGSTTTTATSTTTGGNTASSTAASASAPTGPSTPSGSGPMTPQPLQHTPSPNWGPGHPGH